MNEVINEAVLCLNQIHIKGQIDYPDYVAIMDGLDEIETLKERDELLEGLWDILEDLPMNPETECMEAQFLRFPAGTHREEIWRWFDERHSKGVAYLMYGGRNEWTRK